MKMLTYVLGAKTLTRDLPKTYFIMTENMINYRGVWLWWQLWQINTALV